MVKTVHTQIRKKWKHEFEKYLQDHALDNYALIEHEHSDHLAIQFYDSKDAKRYLDGKYDVKFFRFVG